MEAPTNREKLATAQDMLSKIETTLAVLYQKTASSTSFGDQSRTLASIADLEKSRERWKNEINVLTQAVNSSRRTLKIQFR
jgi:ABC-type enterochelin transport system substrate-binding protein